MGKNIVTAKASFDKESTLIIKGVAVILMFMHHFFTMPELVLESNQYSESFYNIATIACNPFKMCVAIFAFLNGYLYYFNPNKTYTYSFKKVKQTLVSYWIVYIPLLIISLLLKTNTLSLAGIAGGFLGINNDIVVFSWYIEYFIILMLIFPLINTLLEKNTLALVMTVVVLVTVFSTLQLTIGGPVFDDLYLHFVMWIPSTIAGLIFAKYSVFDTYFNRYFVNPIKSKLLRCVVLFIIILFAMFFRVFSMMISVEQPVFGIYWGTYLSYDIICAPLVVYGIYNLHNVIRIKAWDKVISSIGKYSLYMWLIHSVFFGSLRDYTQKVLYCTRFPLLVLVIGLAICYVLSLIADVPAGKILGKRNK